jgi:hypothetical protein
MPRKPQKPRPIEDPAEYQRFVEAARALGVDESPDALDRAFERVTVRQCQDKEKVPSAARAASRNRRKG